MLAANNSTKFFYTGFQRCGTKSFKNIVSQNGHKTVSWQECEKNDWALKVLEGKFDEVIESDDFKKSDFYEDFPFQVFGFIEYLAEAFPRAKFVHVERDPFDWFESMVAHSGGASPGMDDCYTHAVYYERMELWEYLCDKLGRRPRKLPIISSQHHYTKFYVKENLRIINFFNNKLPSNRYMVAKLEDPNLYTKISDFMGFPNTQPTGFHKSDKSNALQQLKGNYPFI